MQKLDIKVIEALYEDLRRFNTSKIEILRAWRNTFDVKRTDTFYAVLHGKQPSSPAQYEFMNDWIPTYWKHHFKAENFEKRLKEIM